jgi:RNA polymerase sigma factor (sigma-70 family)
MIDDDGREMTDDEFREMLAQLRKGDSAASQRIFLYLKEKLEPRVSPVLRFQFAKVGEKADSNDVLHDVLCRIVVYLRERGEESCEGFEHLERLAARVLRHTLIDLTRKHFGSLKSHSLGESSEDFDPRLSESSHLEGWRIRASVHELVGKLDPEDRNVIDLAIYFNFSNAELARSLGVSHGQASRRLSQAKERLGQLIRDEKEKEKQKEEKRKPG